MFNEAEQALSPASERWRSPTGVVNAATQWQNEALQRSDLRTHSRAGEHPPREEQQKEAAGTQGCRGLLTSLRVLGVPTSEQPFQHTGTVAQAPSAPLVTWNPARYRLPQPGV